MLKIDSEFRIYDYSPRKAVKGLIQAGFISDDDLGYILNKVLKHQKGEQIIIEWDGIIDKVFETGLLKYHQVTLHTTPVYMEGFPVSSEVSNDVYYAIEGVNKPMTLSDINNTFNHIYGNFVAICRKGTTGKLELTGFVY